MGGDYSNQSSVEAGQALSCSHAIMISACPLNSRLMTDN